MSESIHHQFLPNSNLTEKLTDKNIQVGDDPTEK
jgi:hypothetical protein